MKKFLSSSVCGLANALGVPLGEGEVPAAGEVVVVVVAGDIAVAGDIPGTVAVAPGTAGAAGVIPGAVIGAVVAAVAGDIAGAVAGDIAVAGDVIGAVAGLVAVVGAVAGDRVAGGVAGGWPNEVSARVTEQRLAISSVFIGLIREFSRPRISMSWVSSSGR